MMNLAMFGLGGTELFLILLVVLILFGASRIPQFFRGLGEGIREFRSATRTDATTPPQNSQKPLNRS